MNIIQKLAKTLKLNNKEQKSFLSPTVVELTESPHSLPSPYYRDKDMIHFKYFNPQDFFYGLSPIAAARQSLGSLDSAQAYNKAFLTTPPRCPEYFPQTRGLKRARAKSHFWKAG